MEKTLPRIVYMGTPDFAVYSLKALYEAGYPIAMVVTVPDKPAGRGLKLHASPVKEYALAVGLPVLQPTKLTDPEFVEALRNSKPDIGVVVAFRKLPKEVYTLPPLGFFNLHASLLPQYRGAAPINWAVINGDKESGVTTFLLSNTIDAGQILLQTSTPIDTNTTAGELHDVLATLGAPLVCQTVEGLWQKTLSPKPQDETNTLRPAPKIFRTDCKISWNLEAAQVHNFIRGLAPTPSAWTTMQIGSKTEDVKLFDSFCLDSTSSLPELSCGEVYVHPDHKTLVVGCGRRTQIYIAGIQPAGKRRMTVHDFLLGLTRRDIRFI